LYLSEMESDLQKCQWIFRSWLIGIW
jgi:hypothetical protein